ncbi:MAG: response regulator [Candidatus Riflebacteria bacterium]|nr:response regulator [Candidatus Riflebacteria bacterium]
MNELTDIDEIERIVRREPRPRLDLPAVLILLINILLLSIFVTTMTNLIARSIQALLVVLIWSFFLVLGWNYPQIRTYGWNWILIGLNLISFGLIISIFDHVFVLNAVEPLRDNERFRLFLEQVVGSSLGFALLAYGFFKWVPSFMESKLVMANYAQKLLETVKTQKEELIRAEEKAKQAEQIARLQDFNEKILSTIPLALLVLDRQCHGLTANSHFARLFSHDAATVRGRSLAELVPSEALQRAVDTASSQHKLVEAEVKLRSGENDLWFDMAVSGESTELILCVFDDITQKKHTTEMEKQLQVQLLQSEKLSALGELVSGVAHELNNPLAIISGYSELLMEETDLADQTKDLMKEIAKSSFRCKKIVENLLTFARQHKPERELIDLNQIVRDALALRAHQLRVDNIAVVDELTSVSATIADPYQLQQVFFNIINNAYQAMKSLRKEGNKLTVRSRERDGMVRIEIGDNGPGIPDALMKRIFDPFFTTKKLGEGTGLGLSISYGIVKEHQGKITVESAAGQGATFVVEIPINQQKPLAESVRLEPEVATSIFLGKRILVVDDEENIAAVCRMGLERLGCLVEVTADGADAISRLRQGRFDLVVSDIRMPGLDGPAIYSAVRQTDPALADRIIFMTGDTLSPQTKAFLETSGNLYINKPFVLDELKTAIAKTLETAAA